MNLKPFNLSEAKAGKPVVTRNGRKVLELHYFENTDIKYPIVASVEGHDYLPTFTCDGRESVDSNSDTDNDLFMATEKREGWVNVYRNDVGSRYIGSIIFATEGLARYHENKNTKYIHILTPIEGVSKDYYITTTKITWEE